MPIRVLHIVGIVCGGGVEAVILNYYKNIDRRKIQFDFVVDGDGLRYFDEVVSELGGKVYHITPYRKNIFKYMKQIFYIVKENGYKIVHSNMNSLALFSLFPSWLAGAKIRILHNHSTAIKSEKSRFILKMILRPLAPICANKYFACSKLAGSWMFGTNEMNSGNVTILNNAIDLDEYAFDKKIRDSYRESLNIPPDALVIGHVGRFMYQKNHLYLIKVFQHVYQKNHKAYLLLVGDGELRSNIQKKVEEYQIENNVLFLGLRTDVKNLYNAMDVFVLPSWYEGLPVVAVEAQANGLQSFFSNYVTAESNLSESAHFLSIDEKPSVWAFHILNIDCSRNLNAREQMRKSGFDIKESAKLLMRVYAELGNKNL